MAAVREISVPYFVYDGQTSDMGTEQAGKKYSPGFYMVPVIGISWEML